ncbi:ATP-binding protein [Streptomyces cavernicola]|uniref:ATP-binding protein n=1 Tax=Streptomyces cavernicola TaxID=3043613 RepID=A0ABT6S2P6_9ACTN|nr:ATP-binding protein [Streptomyces sp. B-S-A6]MDI3402370.1 ATP-binding protein [Streptomyces sp. B-S-A6]
MTNETAPSPPASAAQLDRTARHFAMRFSSTPRGARLARRLAAERLDAWGVSYGSDAHDAVVLIVAELAANAVQHGRVPGRDFHLRLLAAGATARAEVTDTRTERVPVPSLPVGADAEGGRGLLLVECLASRWGWTPRSAAPGKTVWAEFVLPAELGG